MLLSVAAVVLVVLGFPLLLSVDVTVDVVVDVVVGVVVGVVVAVAVAVDVRDAVGDPAACRLLLTGLRTNCPDAAATRPLNTGAGVKGRDLNSMYTVMHTYTI